MNEEENYKEINRESWNGRVDTHLASEFYDVEGFLKGKTSLKEIELALLGDVKGKRILHLQCHFGQDTLSLARMGATVVGADISDTAIAAAENLATKMNLKAEFVCCDLYELPNHLDGEFDIVFTSYGTIGWLPDLKSWAGVVSHFLKPGGRFVFAEFHPVAWMFDNDFTHVAYKYSKDAPIAEEEEGTYADKSADITIKYVSWNHGLAEVFTALTSFNIVIDTFQEFDYSPYDSFPEMVEVESGKFRIKHLGDKIPLVYALAGTKS